jgi:drug/metabolite transporter (DMT)-like permease
MRLKYINKNLFYITILILTISINLLSIIAGKYLGINLGFSRTFIFWLAILITAYGSKFFFWFFLHRKFKLSFIYPILSVNYFFSLILGKVLFQEAITIQKVIGSIVIVIGVFTIMMSSKKLEGI